MDKKINSRLKEIRQRLNVIQQMKASGHVNYSMAKEYAALREEERHLVEALAYTPEPDKTKERITALEDVLKKLTDLGDGCYVGWHESYGQFKTYYNPFCKYCGEKWDRDFDGDVHKDNCPVEIARRLLAED